MVVVVVVRVHRGHRLLHRPAFRSLSLCPAVGPITLPVQHTLEPNSESAANAIFVPDLFSKSSYLQESR